MPRRRRRGKPSVRDLIVRFALKYGVDPQAALAVARTEGGLGYGAVGDAGTSFGPFQLHVGGALPAGRDAAWANSPAGLKYALRSMASAGAAGLTGEAAINAIVRQFERPADPDAQVRKALGLYGGDGSAPAATSLPAAGHPGSTPGASTKQAGIDALNLLAQGGDPLEALRLLSNPTVTAQPQQGPPGAVMRPLQTDPGEGSEFGYRDAEGAPDKTGTRRHAAKDWFAPAGSPVGSPVDGVIVEVTPSRGSSGQVYGGTVKVQAADGMVFVFRHVDPGQFRVGQQVRAGTPIAGVAQWDDGSPHAHIEIWRTLQGGYRYENMIDPMTYFA